MGIYLNPGNENFKETTKSNIYVDKTGMIRIMNQFMDSGNKYVCICRPRRFGKTIAGNMLDTFKEAANNCARSVLEMLKKL